VKPARDELHVLTGGYVLDALGAQEREAFGRHLQHCASCQAEVRGLRETAARLALAQARRPPARMQQRVLAASYRTRQLPPLLAPVLPARPARHRLPLLAPVLPARPARHRRRVPRPVLALAAASVAAALAFGVTQVTGPQPPATSSQTVRTSLGGAVILVAAPARQDAVLTAARLPSLPGGRVYQVWVIGPVGTRSAGFLSGAALALTGLRAGERVAVTVEPAGGTSRPTTAPIVLVPVPASR
jgi:anti-sigma-K factor RskA